MVFHSVGGTQTDNRVLWKLFGPKRDEVTEEWKDYLTRSLNISTPNTRMIKSRRMRRAGHVSYIRDRTVLWCGDLRDRPRGRTRCRWIILTWIFKTLDWEVMERIDILLDREKWWVF